jgi:hypothetical protein
MIKKTAIIVVIIIGALVFVKANLFVYNWVCIIQDHRRYHEKRSIGEIEKALHIYKLQHNGRVPDSIEVLAKEGSDERPPLLRSGAVVDSWRTPYRFEKNGKTWTITSAGPDRKFGTKDDVTNMREP